MYILRVTILGCGSSGGVPRIGPQGPYWGACDPENIKNRRTRCSLLVEQWRAGAPEAKTVVLVDTSPDLREQMLQVGVGLVDGVIYTHDHADQTHGIDDLRMICLNKGRPVEVWMDAATEQSLVARFSYCFAQETCYYPPILSVRTIPRDLSCFYVEGAGGALPILPIDQDHGATSSLGFRFGPLVYSSDVVGFSQESFGRIRGAEYWIVDALQYQPHISHAHVDMAVGWIQTLGIPHGILTNLHTKLDYETLAAYLPAGIVPAYDGLVVETSYT